MSGEDDDAPRETDFDDAPDTQKVEIEAVPEFAETKDSTGKYKTGYEVSADVQSELAFGRGCAHCTKKFMTALKLWLMSLRVHESVAQVRVDKLLIWMNDPENAELIRVTMKNGG